jgi:hypothetical protein
LSGVLSSLKDGSWKKKQSTFAIKEENQVNTLITQLTTSLFELAKEKEEGQKGLQANTQVKS